MLTLRYTRWDGRQRVRLDAERVFEKLGEYLSYTDDVQQALEWLMRQGMDLPDQRIVGLDDLLERVRGAMRDRQHAFDLGSALDDVRRRLDELLDLERDTLSERIRRRPELDAKREFLDRLPHGIAAALERLREYAFEDALAGEELARLLEDLEDIRRVEAFLRRAADLFNGPKPVDFEGAVALEREMEALRQLERVLMSGDLSGVRVDDLRQVLGTEATQELEDLRALMALLHESGYLLQRQGHVRLSPKGVRKIGQMALRDIYQGLARDRPGTHAIDRRGAATLRPQATRAYRFGDPMHLDVVSTLKQALARDPSRPLRLAPADFQVHEADDATSTSTVLLLDMSWSMSWEGRFAAGKKVAMALESLIRTRYPRDYFAIVGFFTRATELKARDLPEASWNMGDPFTNLQDGLRLAADLLRRHRSANQHFIVITDGQPTAYFHDKRLYCEWPLSFGGISMRAAQETLREVERVTRMGITINTFMLDDSPSLRAFVERMTRINRGRAFYTRPDRLGEYLLVDYIERKRRKV